MSFKISVIKKNQILTWSVTLMLVIAGYLNYQNDARNPYEKEVSGIIDENLGDAVFVDSSSLVTNSNTVIKDLSNENLKHTSAEFFSEGRINRNSTYAEQLESYENIVKDSNLDEKQKDFAKEEIKRINDEKNAISIAESLIKLKGIEDVIILVNGDSVNAVLLEEKLTDEIVAKVQHVIENELDVDVEDIHISSFTEK